MGMAWIQILDVAGALLGFTVLFAVLLMLGKVPAVSGEARPHRHRSL